MPPRDSTAFGGKADVGDFAVLLPARLQIE
jgi:hypothetical protein